VAGKALKCADVAFRLGQWDRPLDVGVSDQSCRRPIFAAKNNSVLLVREEEAAAAPHGSGGERAATVIGGRSIAANIDDRPP